MSSKLSKKELINDIRYFYIKQGIECDNIYNVSKKKLLQIIIDNDIPHINEDICRKEIEETEKFNYYFQIIHHNFRKYKNIPFHDIKPITFNSNSSHLNELILSHNLKFDNDIQETNELVNQLFKHIDNYCLSTNNINTIQFKTIPDIIQFLSSIQNLNTNK